MDATFLSLRASRRQLLRAAGALGLVSILPAARACEFFCSSLRVYKPYARETLAGDTSVIVGMTLDEVVQDDRLIGVTSPLATSAELGGVGAGPSGIDLPIRRGQVLVLHEDTTYIRLLGLKQPLGLGREYPLTLHFEKAGVVDADIDVSYTRNQSIK
ncbi:MAG TPA: copper chaperone PCu(A)C [Ideonella sp.]|uniref:copper chaperone PCu(A)C n=1 Tax=Ideonella sp. TaxID=1929293 RepID=UPI002CB49F4D|nr:copper chaperone PCu(A)C [Ideonella sp.]HSI52166.1 copper chaperone PCu(A)C [Ideonella sp.]